MLLGWVALMVLSTLAFFDDSKTLATTLLIIGTATCSFTTVYFIKELNNKRFWASQDELDEEIKLYKAKR